MELDFRNLIDIFPKPLATSLRIFPNKNSIIEITLDLGHRPEVRLSNTSQFISFQNTSWEDLNYTIKQIGKFSKDNRANIKETLHRISCIRNKYGIIIGLTCRIGRSTVGILNIIRDFIETNNSLLILGKPGTGKTTIIREIGRVFADEQRKRVIIIDMSNEIAGNDNIIHSSVGNARRMQISEYKSQDDILIEAIKNHMPEVIIVDEISTEHEALAISTAAERGVQLIATTHGQDLSSLLKNTNLVRLTGGIQNVVLSDEEAKRRGRSKTTLERRNLPVFQQAIELHSNQSWRIYDNFTASLDNFLVNGKLSNCQLRLRYGQLSKIRESCNSNDPISLKRKRFSLSQYRNVKSRRSNKLLIFPRVLAKPKIFILVYSLDDNYFEKLRFLLQEGALFTTDPNKADIIITSSFSLYKNVSFLGKLYRERKTIIHSLSNFTNYKL